MARFEVGIKGQEPFTVEADNWDFSNAVVCSLDGLIVLVVPPGEWNYARWLPEQQGEEDNDANQ